MIRLWIRPETRTLVSFALVIFIFWFDCRTELSVAIGTFYTIPVIISLNTKNRTTWLLTLVSIFLIVVGYFLSPQIQDGWHPFENRAISAIIIIAIAKFGTELTKASNLTPEQTKITALVKEGSDKKSEFIGNITHEMRVPLATILGYTDLFLANKKYARDEQLSYVDRIRNNCNHLLSLTGDFLDIAKIEAGQLSIKATPCDLHEEFEVVQGIIQIKADAKNLNLETTVDENVPRFAQVDAQRLRQILINLLGNAVKFTQSGSVHLSIHADDVDDGYRSVLSFRVQDTGIGIPAQQRATIFDRFSEAHGQVEKRCGGYGIGLSLSRTLARAMGGDLSLEESSPGTGCSFLLTLPVKRSDDHEYGRPQSTDKTATFQFSNCRVLLVEDAPDLAFLYRKFLEKHRIKVDDVKTGRDAVTLAAAHRYNVILMDLNLPDMDGFEATRRIKRNGSYTPVIGLSADARFIGNNKWKELGIDGLRAKPASEQEICNLIKSGYRVPFRNVSAIRIAANPEQQRWN